MQLVRDAHAFCLALGATCNPKSGVKVVERTRGNTGIPKRMVRSAGKRNRQKYVA